MLKVQKIFWWLAIGIMGTGCAEKDSSVSQAPTASMEPAAIVSESGEFNCILSELLENPTHEVSISGNPERVSDAVMGEVVLFDGVDDAVFINTNPLEGLTRFTVEIIFRQDGGGSMEPRFFHIGHAKGDRMLLETRLTDDGQWHLDSFLRSGEAYQVLIDPQQNHPVGEWAHVALVLEDGHMRHYVNGKQELAGQLEFNPIIGGSMSLGVRLGLRHWFKGAIHSIRVTPEALKVESFLPEASKF